MKCRLRKQEKVKLVLKLTNLYVDYEYSYRGSFRFPIKSEIKSNEIFLNSNHIVKFYEGNRLFSFSENLYAEVTIIETSDGKSIKVKEDIENIRSLIDA